MRLSKQESSNALNLHRQLGKLIQPGISIETAQFKENAYNIYKHSRLNDPILLVYQGELGKEWLITKYQDAKRLLRDSRLTKNSANVFSKENIPKTLHGKNAEQLTTFMFQLDGEAHKHLRSFAQKPFKFDMVAKSKENIHQISNELLNTIKLKNSFDLVKEYAELIPIYTMSNLLGLPKKDRKQFKIWIDFFLEIPKTDEENKFKEIELSKFFNYLQDLITLKSMEPSKDLISHLISTKKKGKHLTPKELYSMIALLIVTGYKPIACLITNTMLALFENPDQFEKLKKDMTLIDFTIEESLRYYPPAEVTTARWAIEPFELYHQTIQAGDMITISLASANRDETIFEHPEIFDISRKNNKHIAFAPGPHTCLGSHLARLETKIAISNLIKHIPSMKIKGYREDFKWQANYALRHINELPIIVGNN